jgi:hypothetical protein
VSLSHRPTRNVQNYVCPSQPCIASPYSTGTYPHSAHGTRDRRLAHDHQSLLYACFLRNRIEILRMFWAVLSVHHASRAHRVGRPDVRVEDRRKNTAWAFTASPFKRECVRLNARLLIISTTEDHIRPSHSHITLFPILNRALDFMVYCIRGSGATGRAYRRCMGREPLAWSTHLKLFLFWEHAMVFW